MEVTWYGRTCIRLRGKDAVVVTDPYQAVVGPTGRGITGDIVTISHPDDTPLRKAKGTPSRDGLTLLPSSLEAAFVLDGPGEYEVKDVLLTGVRTYRDDVRGEEHGESVSFAVEIDGIHVVRLGDIGHLLSEEKLGNIGSVDIACVPLGGTLGPTKAAELVELDPVIVPMPLCDDEALRPGPQALLPRDGREPVTQPKLSVTASSLPSETEADHAFSSPAASRSSAARPTLGIASPHGQGSRERLPIERPGPRGGRWNPEGFVHG